ncbi:hypothetical protein OC834_006391 [Tilletia horrida]|nr:hypothetical protein OC834_006391 [Tilletia horrida]
MSQANTTTGWPTFLALTGDAIFAQRDEREPENLIRAFFFDSEMHTIEGHLFSPCADEGRDGWFTIRNFPATTRPLKLLDAGDENLRKVPEEVDGSVPNTRAMDWMSMGASGIAVVREVDRNANEGWLMGFTYMGRSRGWIRFDVQVDIEGIELPSPLQVHALVNFEAVVTHVGLSGVPYLRVDQLIPVGIADANLVVALTE